MKDLRLEKKISYRDVWKSRTTHERKEGEGSRTDRTRRNISSVRRMYLVPALEENRSEPQRVAGLSLTFDIISKRNRDEERSRESHKKECVCGK